MLEAEERTYLCSFTALSLLFRTWCVSENIYWWAFQVCWVLARCIVLNFITVNAQLRQPDFSHIWVLELLPDLISTQKWFLHRNGTMLLTLFVVTLPHSHWPAMEDRPDNSPNQYFISVHSSASYFSPFYFPICRCSFCKELEWRKSQLQDCTGFSSYHCGIFNTKRLNSECCYQYIIISSKYPFLVAVASIWPLLEHTARVWLCCVFVSPSEIPNCTLVF